MISEGSCDIEDAKNSALILHFKIYSDLKVILKCNISQYFYCIFDQINAAFVSIRDLFQKH